MKTILTLFALLTLSVSAFSQNEQFRVDCNLVSFLKGLDSEWSDWVEANNTFVINANDNNDIIHYRGDGEVVVYRNLGGLETLYTKTGERYQIVCVLDEDGNQMSFQMFDDLEIGVKLIKEGFIIQFANYQ
jgi:hypothetical protein